MKRQQWNSNKLCLVKSDEFQYLETIDGVIKQSNKIELDLYRISQIEYWNIKNNKEKLMTDFGELRSKLKEVQELIDNINNRR